MINGIRKSYTKLFESILKDRILYCFGAGHIMETILDGFKYRDKLAGILDNDQSKWGCHLKGVNILSPNHFCRDDSDRIVILITTDFSEQIENQLNDMGFKYVFYYSFIVTNAMNVCRGNYGSWDEARNACRGYNHKIILEKVREATQKVINGEAVYERDSVLFYEKEYNFKMLASLLYVYANEGKISIIDFGGALGSIYFQHKELLTKFKLIKWNIVEQANFVACGKELVSPKEKKVQFYDNLEQDNFSSCNCLILSSSIEYVENPYSYLRRLTDLDCKYIILDSMPFIDHEDRLCIQTVPSAIYDADYPVWLINQDKFMCVLKEKYKTIFKWKTESSLWLDDEQECLIYQGMLLQLK